MNKKDIEVFDLPDEIRYYKTSCKDELNVLHASSDENSIRFYLNDAQYLVGYDDDESKIFFGDDNEIDIHMMKKIMKINLGQNRHKSKVILVGFFSMIISIILILFSSYFLKGIFQYHMLYALSMAGISSILIITSIVAIINLDTPKEAKSKHAAEHMMVNFLEKHKRLPNSLEELKNASRFSNKCGTRSQVEAAARISVQLVMSTIIACLCELVVCDLAIVYIIVYLISYFLIGYFSHQGQCLYFLVKPIKNLFNLAGQLGNTTKKVRDEDLKLAFNVCWVWTQIVYPEYFYDEDGGLNL